MLRALSRTPIRNQFIKPTLPTITRKMVSGYGAAENSDLTASKLFDVSKFSAVVTGGGTGIGLMMAQVYTVFHN